MVDLLGVGMKLHAQYSEDRAFYPATVVEISMAKKRAKAPVKVCFDGYIDEEWKSIEQLQSRRLPKCKPDGGKVAHEEPKAQAKAKVKSSSESQLTLSAGRTQQAAKPTVSSRASIRSQVTETDTETLMPVPPAPAALLQKMGRRMMLSAADEKLLQEPWCRPTVALENYTQEHKARLHANSENKRTVKELRKSVQNVFKDGTVARVLAASLPHDSAIRQLDNQLQGVIFHISPAERSANRGGSRRFNVPMPVFRQVCDILHMRNVVTPCLNDFKTFLPGRWKLSWVDLSTETAQWLVATFNVLTRAGFWQITVTRDHEVISAFPIAAGRLASSDSMELCSEDNPQRCGECRGCMAAGDQWSLLPSVQANFVHIRRPMDSVQRRPCSCGLLASKNLSDQFRCTCEPCEGELRMWAKAVKEFESCLDNVGCDWNAASKSLLSATTAACGSCLQDRRCVAEAIKAGCPPETIRNTLLPWLEKTEPEEVMLRVCEVRFSQDSINSSFTGEHKGQDIESLVRAFRLGLLLPTDKPIRVVWYHGEFWALDHRRLWAIQQYQLLEPLEDVHVRAQVLPLCDIDKTTATAAAVKEFNKKYSTVSDGTRMHIKRTPIEGSGTPAMNRTALASVVFGDLKQVRGTRDSLQGAMFKLGDQTFCSVREVKEKLELLKGDHAEGDPLSREDFRLLMSLLEFHPEAATQNQDVVCITVATSEAFRTPAFWLWKESGEGRDTSMKDCLGHLEYFLTSSPTRNRDLIDILSQDRHRGCLDHVGPRFSSIKLTEDISISGDSFAAGTPLFVVTHDMPQGSVVGSLLSFLVFRWKEGCKNAGKLGAVDIACASDHDAS
eukprot:TRINITY_DN26945_c0_g1_i1.p1 TRINITY_DN26945_c0_g1~~TRINITY_DN26945_c0_g1_i1.p1  ORF type:complete len:841 (-),score=117.99 TRINITY_DN26945_c0_g1_i1:304-2826(-)